jgi:hypothetical protein
MEKLMIWLKLTHKTLLDHSQKEHDCMQAL